MTAIWDGEPLSARELDALALYNSERYRGLVHSPDWRTRMAALQARFDAYTDDNWCDSHAQWRWACRRGPVVGACIVGMTL